ncbi:MAG: MOSC domain-containing protein [Termitinemataceae bacterium]|nr:MAG: MOSC domain-containing protein [Termitinemataceae bacterium]
MGKIIAVCISEKKGTQKKPVESAEFVQAHGIEGDAHAGNWHRQVSLLSFNKIEEFRARGGKVDYGAFGENLVVEDIDFARLPVGTFLKCGCVSMRITQIGKECHKHCAIFEQTGDCIMPREGVFAEILKGGKIQTGDELIVL